MGKHRKPEKQVGNGNARQSQKFNKKSSRSQLLFEPRPEWYTQDLKPIALPESFGTVPLSLIEKLQTYAKQLHAAEAAQYEASNQQASSAHKFYTTIMTSGTWSDKVSALTLLVQESPLHNVKAFENLLGMANKKSRQQALMALGALKDMLAAGTMLPSDRKLRHFGKQPELLAALQDVKPSWSQDDPLPEGLDRKHLVFWAFEDWLKQKYFHLLTIMERWLGDEVEFARLRAITFIYELLKEKPEQEENLLRLIVNKLGDVNKKVASRASYLCLQLEAAHPSMKAVVTAAIESEVLVRTGQSSHAIYYAAITINQTILSSNDPETANKLLEIYFGLFVRLLGRSKTETEKEKEEAKKQAVEDSKKRKRPSKSSDIDNKSTLELNDKIIAQVLTGVNRAFPYTKAAPVTYEKHLETLYRITHSSNFNTSIQALQLIQQISTAHNITTDRFMRTLYESLLDPRLIASSKQTMYLNLLYRALKSDPSIARVQAFVKRILQILTLHEPPFITAALFLILELQSIYPSIKTMFSTPETPDDDEEEHYADVPSPRASPEPSTTTSKPTTTLPLRPRYDAKKRDPLHANAAAAPLWDILPPTTHYHPSVSLFATSLLHPESVTKKPTKPDPVSHTLIHFLDRFAYRNAKTKHLSNTKGTSLMQPALITSSDGLLTADRKSSAGGIPVNSEAFWGRKAEDVKAEDVFFHKYFAESGVGKRKGKKGKGDADANAKDKYRAGKDDDDWDSEVGADEGEIWKALVGGKEQDDVIDSAGEEDEEFERLMNDEGSNDSGSDDGDGGVELNLESDEDINVDAFADEDVDFDDQDGEANEDDDDDDAEDEDPFGFGEEDDILDDDILDEDEEEPEEEEEEVDEDARPRKKTKTEENKAKREERKKKKALPMFASADDYEKMINEGEGPDGGEDYD